MDFEALAARQIRVMWVGAVWFVAAFMPFFLIPWRWVPATGVAGVLLLAGGWAALQGARASTGLGRHWRHLFLTVPVVLLVVSVALAVLVADQY